MDAIVALNRKVELHRQGKYVITSLGSTLAIKLLSHVPVDDAAPCSTPWITTVLFRRLATCCSPFI